MIWNIFYANGLARHTNVAHRVNIIGMKCADWDIGLMGRVGQKRQCKNGRIWCNMDWKIVFGLCCLIIAILFSSFEFWKKK